MPEITDQLEQHLERFGLAAFRPGQREVISAVVAQKDCLCIMPTGGGKSLCYQLPAVARDGLTLVVSPLIALMKDQVDALQAIGISATFINSSLTLGEQRDRMDRMATGEYDLVYIAPERLRNSSFLEKLKATPFQLLAIDEAHCISEWGHDFRPDYARIGRLRQRLGYPQTIALTATATPAVRTDIAKQLELREPEVFITGFSRSNLHFSVVHAPGNVEKQQTLLSFLEATPGAGIIYASTRKRCEELRADLKENLDRRAAVYHAGLTPEERHRVQDEFMSDRVPIIVATNAFGMGIDKPDLRFVVHYNIPGSIEAYYQEAGRAGRDGLQSKCLLIYSPVDRRIQEYFIDNAYPAPEIVKQVYDFLRSIDDDPIEITLQEIKDRLNLSITSEGVSSCEKLLEKCGAIERLDSRQNTAAVKIDSDLPTLVDLLPREAKNQRRVLRAIEGLVGDLRHERVFVSPSAIMRAADLDLAATNRALRELAKLQAFDYIPPFRGRAVHVLERSKDFRQLGIDFAEQDRRKQAEYSKLDRMIAYATSRKCRQLSILEYFGDPERKLCGLCDNCGGGRPVSEASLGAPADGEQTLEAVRMVLAGAARLQGRFGKTILVQMLCGSQSAKIVKLKLDQLSTFGLFSRFMQTEVTALVEAILAARLLEQVEAQKFRPTIQLTTLGEDVMRGKASLDGPLAIDASLQQRIRLLLGSKHSAASGPVATTPATASSPAFPAPVAPTKPAEISRESSSAYDDATEPESFGEAFESHAARTETSSTEIPPHATVSTTHTLDDPSPVEPESQIPPLPQIPHDSHDRYRPPHYWTWRVLSAGFSAEQCQLIRQIDSDVLFDQVLRAAREGLTVDPLWLLSAEQHAALIELIGSESPDRIHPLLASLPAGLKYRDVQLYLLTRKPD